MFHCLDYFQCCCCCPQEGVVEAHPSSVTVKKEGAKRQHPIVKFFNGPYYRFITHPIWRCVIIAFYFALLSVFIYFASQIKVNEEQVAFLAIVLLLHLFGVFQIMK